MSSLKAMELDPKDAALYVSAENNKGIFGVDLSGYATVNHVHEEYAPKEHTHDFNLRYDVLYSGTAKEEGTVYPLSKPVSEYRLIIIFGAGYHRDEKEFAHNSSVTLYTEDLSFENRAVSWNIFFANGSAVGGCFNTPGSFILRSQKSNTPVWDYTAVRRIIGIY